MIMHNNTFSGFLSSTALECDPCVYIESRTLVFTQTAGRVSAFVFLNSIQNAPMAALFIDLQVVSNNIESFDFQVFRPITNVHTFVLDGLTIEGNRKSLHHPKMQSLAHKTHCFRS